MHRSTRRVCFAALILLASATGAMALEVKLHVSNPGPARQASPVTTGVPFAKGALSDASRLAVTAQGKAIPAQFIPTVKWDDGSIRWVLMDIQAALPAGATNEFVLTDAGGNVAPPSPVKVEDAPAAVKVSTGPLQFTVNKQKFNLFESIKVDGKELVTAGGRGLVLYTTDGREVAAANPTVVTIEQAGPLRAIVCLKGKYADLHKGLLAYTVRITAYAGRKALKLTAWLENEGGMGYYHAGDDNPSAAINMDWFFFDGMAVELGLGLGDTVTARCEGVEAPASFQVSQYCLQAKGQEKERHKRQPFYTWNGFEYSITGGTNILKKAERTDGIVALKGSGGALTAGIGDFWQNYEKSIQLDGQKLRFWLWPRDGQWPRAGIKHTANEIFDRKLVEAQKDGGYNYVGAAHKGHTILLDFSGADPVAVDADLNTPLMALASAAYYAGSEAALGLFAPPEVRTDDSECNFKIGAWIRASRSSADPASETSIHAARKAAPKETIYSYGWMDFGDISVPGHGAVSLHYDWLWVMLLQTLRNSDMNSFYLAREMATHRIDVDTLWSDLDLAETRGMQRGGPFVQFHGGRLRWVPGVSGNWMTGLGLYYMLTGEPKALEACHRGAQGLRAGWDWVREAKPYGGPQGDMLANARSMAVYCEMFDLTADKAWLADATRLFTDHVVPKWKALGPHLHGNEQIQGQGYLKDDQKYCFSIEYLCEFQRHTNNEEAMKLLQEGADKEFPGTFFDAPMFLSGLYAYVGARTGKKEYLTKAAEAFVNGFPESKSPPVFLPNNSTWSQQAAMMLRSGQLLQYASWKLAAAQK